MRTHRRRGALPSLLLLAVAVTLSSQSESAPPNDYGDPATWLCLPGGDDACAVDLDTTVIYADGRTRIETYAADPDAPIDCFYVYPTVSEDPTPNADMTPGREEQAVIAGQFARFSSRCRPFAPLYRQVTLTALRSAITGQPVEADRELAYRDVSDAWNHYLDQHNDGRGVVLVGHSQGAGMLARLLREEIEGQPAESLLVSALLIGTSLQVAEGEPTGGSFRSLPLCRSADQTGCLITFAAFRETLPPPDHSRFGRDAGDGVEAACTNPAGLAGGAGELDAYLASGPTGIAAGSEAPVPQWLDSGEPVTTPFVRLPGLLEAECVRDRDRGFHYLAIRVRADSENGRTDHIGGDVVGPDGQVLADWGLHLIDMHLAMGNLLDIIGRQADAWARR